VVFKKNCHKFIGQHHRRVHFKGNGAGTFTKESTSKGEDMEGKIEEKRISGEATIQASRKYTSTKKIKNRIKGALRPGASKGH